MKLKTLFIEDEEKIRTNLIKIFDGETIGERPSVRAEGDADGVSAGRGSRWNRQAESDHAGGRISGITRRIDRRGGLVACGPARSLPA